MDTPSAHVRVVLVAARQRAVPFDAAWEAAMRSLPRPAHPDLAAELEEWRRTLRWTRPHFQAAYESQQHGAGTGVPA